MDYIKAIKMRESIRSYKKTTIKPKDMVKIKQLVDQEYSVPFGNDIRFEIIDFINTNETIGTYGIIKNAQVFIAGITNNSDESMLDFGYAFEELILKLTLLNIGTCWLGGTFKRKDFKNKITTNENEFFPCITPIGYPKNKKRIIDHLMRRFAGSDHRKEWTELFFYKNFDNQLNKKDCESLRQPLAMVRRSPSASNKQPWRILVSEDYKEVHFFIKRDKKYKSTFEYDIQLIDLGIAMNHFGKSCEQLKISGTWDRQHNMNNFNPFEYVSTFKID